MKILAIETSCDDTGIAVLKVSETENFDVLSNIVSSQIEVHEKYGGVYPMMAKREHQKNLVPVLVKTLKEAQLLRLKKGQPVVVNLSGGKFTTTQKILERETELYKKIVPFLKRYGKPDINLISVTNGPGLEPCLWVGVNFAKCLSYFWDIPIVPVNHIESHILINFLENSDVRFPAIALVVSGGHTQIILMKGIGKYKILGETRDDAAGECFDKCAKILGLGYPGGPTIAKLASQWKSEIQNSKSQKNPKYQIPKLPRPMINSKDYDFSFSGLKTAVLYKWREINKKDLPRDERQRMARGMASEVQQAIIDVLIKKTIKAVKDFKAKSLILGGGVSANQELRKQFQARLESEVVGFFARAKNPTTIKSSKIEFFVPKPDLSTDNGLMTAITGYFHKNKKTAWQKLSAQANLRISK